MSIVRPEPCYSKDHPLNRKEAAEWRSRTLGLAREKVGASGSEGPWDFCCGSLDYVMYTVFNPNEKLPAICDKTIPFWHIVYHGIMLYNTSCESVNSAIKQDRKVWLKNLEFGGRPLAYFYAKFLSSGRNWMGENDCGCATDEELQKCVKGIAREYNEYKSVRHLQFEFMESHRELEKDVIEVIYSSGEKLVFNYNNAPYKYGNTVIEPCNFKIISDKNEKMGKKEMENERAKPSVESVYTC